MKKRIVFVINSLLDGGAERALERLLRWQETAGAEFDPHVVLLDDLPPVRPLFSSIPVHVLDGRGSLFRSLRQLRAMLDRLEPALTVSFLVRANLCTALAMRGRPGKSILCERMHLSSHLAGRYRGIRLAVARLLPRLAYPFADRVLGVSQGVTDDLVEHFGVPRYRAETIYNPYDLESIAAEAAQDVPMWLPDRFLLAVGRLVAAKNFSMLIDAYAASGVTLPLVILGEGEERERLEAQIKQLGLEARVLLPGFVANPFPLMARARWLLSASRNEGFPNAVAEAMALGCPVTITDCPSGPAELVGSAARGQGVTRAPFGLIVADNDSGAMSEAIALGADEALRTHYARAARERMEEFRIEKIAARYWSLFDQMTR